MMSIITVHAAKTGLSKILSRVEAGEEVVIARGKTPVAKIVPLYPVGQKRQFGALRGVIAIGPEFFEPLPEAELAAWE
jgi:antitoxin (DNA-binding transcriptional repressor) of toxin-antitoxin stability system